MDERGNGLIIGILIGLLVAGGLFAAYLWGQNSKTVTTVYPPLNQTQQTQVSATPLVTPEQTASWKNFTNQKYNLTFKYPTDWKVSSYESQGTVLAVQIKGPDQITVSYLSGPPGIGGKCNDDPNIDLGHEKITMFNMPLNLFFDGDKAKNAIEWAYVIKEEDPCPNINFFEIPALSGVDDLSLSHRLGSVALAYGDLKSPTPKQVSDFKSPELETVKQILASFSFIK